MILTNLLLNYVRMLSCKFQLSVLQKIFKWLNPIFRPSLNKSWFAVSDRPAQNAATQKFFSVFRKKKKNFVWFFRNPEIHPKWDRTLALPPGENGVFSSEVVFSHISVNVLKNKRKQNTVLVRKVFIGCHLHEIYVLLNSLRVTFPSLGQGWSKSQSVIIFLLLYTIIHKQM
jgi:hypothetical protein